MQQKFKKTNVSQKVKKNILKNTPDISLLIKNSVILYVHEGI